MKNGWPSQLTPAEADLLKRASKRHQEWVKAHDSGQMFFQLYRCVVCGYEGSHDAIVEHMKAMGCKV